MAVLTPPKFIAAMRRRERMSPNGRVEALLTCRCGEQITVGLVDGYVFDHHAVALGWHVDLTSGEVMVRCPEHRSIV